MSKLKVDQTHSLVTSQIDVNYVGITTIISCPLFMLKSKQLQIRDHSVYIVV